MSNRPAEPEAGWTFFLIILVTGLGVAIFWHYFKGPILEGLRWVRFGELWALNLFSSHRYDACLDWLRNVKLNDTSPSADIVRATNLCFGSAYLSSVPAEDQASYFMLSMPALSGIEKFVTPAIRWVFVVIFITIAIYVIYFSPRNQFRTKHNLESFIKTQAKMWPVISPIVDFNPIKSSARAPGSTVPDKLPLFAEALSPEEWISWHRIPVTNGVVERETARRAFMLQLGPRWNGMEGQPPYVRALLAAFALKGAQKREESDLFLGRIALCWTAKGGFKLTPKVHEEIEKILHDSSLGGRVAAQAKEFAYRATALMGALRWARTMGGVLAPAQFLWLRGVDRPLWYSLNNLGRRSFHAEGAGAIAHFMAESNAKKPLPIPRIDTALTTLNQHLAERGQPIPAREGDDVPASS